MKKVLVIAAIIFYASALFSQISMTNTTPGNPLIVCGAGTGTVLTDDAGGFAPYTGADYTMTLCPDVVGDVVQLEFFAFSLQTASPASNADYLTIYDGNTIGASSLGSYGGNALLNLSVSGTVNNTSGCLTLQFQDNGAANTAAAGFQANIACTTPCANPTSVSSIVGETILDPNTNPHINVCIGESVQFQGSNSFPAVVPGYNFQITDYLWNFDDGQTASTANASHVFTVPGEHLVTLVVTDNNGCNNLNLEPLSVWVSTVPIFSQIAENAPTLGCVGDSIVLSGTFESVQWTSLPPQVVSGETYLPDDAGSTYTSSIVYDFFDPAQTITDCSDIQSVFVNMEHSYIGDLGISITCPNGTSVIMFNDSQLTTGYNTYLGEPFDDGSGTGMAVGVGYQYTWSTTTTNPTMSAAIADGNYFTPNVGSPASNSLSSGTYASQEDLCALVGCPLNGTWTFNVLDDQGADDGFIFQWGLNLNPALFPDVTTFTPSIGIESDSSYWTVADPTISFIVDANNSDMLSIEPLAAGTYDFTYHVINSFGCTNDTTIQITFTDPLLVSAPADATYACGDLTLQAWFQGLPTPSCADCGSFNYCYNNNDNFVWTFCPDNPGDGTTLTFEFLAGQMEGFWEDLTIYDGNSTAAPIIATWSTGDATGQAWSATNTDGCITISFSADGSVSCGSGNYGPWNYSVTPGGPAYTWEWSPTTPINYFDDPTLQAPTISNLNQTTTFTVTGYPVGHPGCASSDEVTISIDPLGDPGQDANLTICANDPAFPLFPELGSSAVTTGTWTDPSGTPIAANPIFDPATSALGDYTYTVALGNCSLFATVNVDMNAPYEMVISDDTAMCYMGNLNMELISQQNGNLPYTYSWDYNGTVVSNSQSYDGLFLDNSGIACLTVTDGCNLVTTECFNVEVKTLVPVTLQAEPETACWPEGMSVEITTDPTLFTQSNFSISDGFSINDQDSIYHEFAEPGIYDVSLTLIDDIGCVYDTTIFGMLTSYNPPVAGWLADPQPADAENTLIQFTDMSDGAIVEYYWEFDTLNHAGNSTEQNPSFTFPPGIGGDYIVYQSVIDTNGCQDYAFGNIHINELFTLFIPNCFTPNGDNINDAMGFVGTDLDEDFFEFTVFNRWGYPVFHTTDPYDHWQGESSDGEYYVPNGIYMWTAKIRSKSTGEKKELTGSITMTR
jgi:gliding motility-associated-like protein